MTKISINGKTYAVVVSELMGGKTSCDQCAFQRRDAEGNDYCLDSMVEECLLYDTEHVHYHFEEVDNV